MKLIRTIMAAFVALGVVAAPASLHAAEAKPGKAKPYPLDTCLVSDEKLGADSGMKTYTFIHEGREIKLCCKGCLKDFKKEPAKYLKKLDAAPKK